MKQIRFFLQTVVMYALLVIFSGNTVFGQLIMVPGNATSVPPGDTTKKEPRSAIKPYASVITKNFITKTGLFTVHQNKDVFYFEVPDSLLGREIMVINRLSKGPAGHGTYAGEELDERTIRFENGPDSSVRVRYTIEFSTADSADYIYKAVERTNQDPLLATLPIIARGKNSSVVDVSKFLKDRTSFVNAVDPGTGLAQNATMTGMKDFNIESIRTYPINVEISISKTVESKAKFLPAGTPVNFTTNTSFIILPKVPMQRRYFDSRVGFFADASYGFTDDQQKVELQQFIARWRLEPKQEDMDKWKRGELVEPQKPIVIYIDPATPKQWQPYLIAGINDWQKSFEQAGFKNAIMGKIWPVNDTTMSMEDARYSMINYLPSETMNAYGPNVHDPRSGEIIQTHIGWFHNVMDLLHSWYMVQAGAVDSRARKAKFDDELMGQLIRFVSSHEVGHTLGLRHNFGSSSMTPVDSLRSKTYLEKYGHTASIMDYARFNYVAQPEDNIPEKDLFPGIHEYDNWAIEWGYRYINAPNAEEDKKLSAKLIEERLPKNPRLWFGDGETKKFDPRCQTEDLSDNAMKAGTYGIKNLQRILPNLPAWTHEEGGGINLNLTNMFKQVIDQYTRYMAHVLKNVGGVRYTIRSANEMTPSVEIVPKAMQQEAVTFFNEQLFKTPTWLLDRKLLDMIVLPESPNFVEDLQVRVLNTLLDGAEINKLLANEKRFGEKAYPATAYIEAIHKGIWQEILSGGAAKIDSYRRNLQKSYIEALNSVLRSKEASVTESDAASIARGELMKLQNEIKQAVPKATDTLTQYHLKDLLERIKVTMNPPKL